MIVDSIFFGTVEIMIVGHRIKHTADGIGIVEKKTGFVAVGKIDRNFDLFQRGCPHAVMKSVGVVNDPHKAGIGKFFSKDTSPFERPHGIINEPVGIFHPFQGIGNIFAVDVNIFVFNSYGMFPADKISG